MEPDRTAALAALAARRASSEALDTVLADGLPGNAFTTLLLHALRTRARARRPTDVLAAAERAEMTHASLRDARRLHAFDGVAFAAAADFEALDLAPVHPLGSSAVAGVDPNNVLTTVRFAEVAADPATGLALHAARARRAGRADVLRLCASQRVLRLQPITHQGYSPHFRLFGLATAARSQDRTGDIRTEHAALVEHLRVWAGLVRRLPDAGFRPATLRVTASDTRLVSAAFSCQGADAHALARKAQAHRPGSTEVLLADAGLDLPRAADDAAAAATELGLEPTLVERARALQAAIGDVLTGELEVRYDFGRLQGLGYYRGPYVQLWVRRDDGLEVPLGDGGALPWLGAWLSQERERLIVTGLSTEGAVAVLG